MTEDGVFLVEEGGRCQPSALYRRIDERALLTERRRPASDRARHLQRGGPRGGLALVNAMGNGVADDDKVVYFYAIEMITYYLDEAPLLALLDLPGAPTGSPRRSRNGTRHHTHNILVWLSCKSWLFPPTMKLIPHRLTAAPPLTGIRNPGRRQNLLARSAIQKPHLWQNMQRCT